LACVETHFFLQKELQNEIQRFITEFKKIESESKDEKLICLNDIFG
jgi:translation initiation factor 2 beta subunit (eIF-2beta)/eIF-5